MQYNDGSMAAPGLGCHLPMPSKAGGLANDMMMAFRVISVLSCICLMPVLLWADVPASDFLSIQYLGKHQAKNGQVCQAFKLIGADNMVDAAAVYYQEVRSPVLYQAGVSEACFTICADRPSRIRVFAMAHTPLRFFLAQTDTALFGRSKSPPERSPADRMVTDMLSIHPYIEVISPGNLYWNQTGQNFQFRIVTPFEVTRRHLSVLENGRRRRLLSNRESVFAYVPAHDRDLREAGPHACRNDILFVRLADGASEFNLTYSLLLHRSRSAFDNHAAGTAVFAFSVLFFAGLVLMKRRTPWWKRCD